MIEPLKRKKLNYSELIAFLIEKFDYDFYITENNVRLYMTDKKNLKKFFTQTDVVLYLKEKGDYQGVIGVWKSKGGGKTRYYVKLNANTFNTAKNLLTVLLWNFEKDLYIKIRKDSKFVSAFKNKGFRFHGGRGCQILLYRKFVQKRKRNERRNFNHNRDSN